MIELERVRLKFDTLEVGELGICLYESETDCARTPGRKHQASGNQPAKDDKQINH